MGGDGVGLLRRQKSLNPDDEPDIVDDVYSKNREPFPSFINIALFGRSDDEYLERLIDKALIKICYSERFEPLWKDREFIANIYSNEHFPKAAETVLQCINDDELDGRDFIGDFVNTEFKRQINEHKRKKQKQ